jgi:hypothetical protein
MYVCFNTAARHIFFTEGVLWRSQARTGPCRKHTKIYGWLLNSNGVVYFACLHDKFSNIFSLIYFIQDNPSKKFKLLQLFRNHLPKSGAKVYTICVMLLNFLRYETIIRTLQHM